MKIYIAIWKDRHTDDCIELFADLALANAWIDERKESYKGRFSDGSSYKWIDNSAPKPEDPETLRWFSYVWESELLRKVVTEEEEGPSGYIEHKEVVVER